MVDFVRPTHYNVMRGSDMPDRDEFSRRPRALKALGAMFERMAAGADPDLATVEAALQKVVASSNGIPSLAAVIEVIGRDRQADFFTAFDELHVVERIRNAVTANGAGKLDKLLERSASSAVLMRAASIQEIVASTLESALAHLVLEARSGVIPVLASRGVSVTAQQLLRPIRSVIDRAADHLVRRPSARKLKLSRSASPVDLHADLRGVAP